jgi:UBX domain-containing protein 1
VFVADSASSARPDTRPFVLQTTFPSKELDDPNLTIEEAKLQNAVVVQRFT